MYKVVSRLINRTELSRNVLGVSEQWRNISTVLEEESQTEKPKKQFATVETVMKCWQLETYGGIKELHMKDNVSVPIVRSPYDVLVEVCASSVNPLDVIMCGNCF